MSKTPRNLQDLISRQMLPRVQSPSQYVGLEINSRLKPGLADGPYDVIVAMAFPDSYGVGISHLGTQILYHMLNDSPGIACDRAYCPKPDAEAVMRAHNIPLFGWESRCHLRDFDIVGFSLGYEICATNVLTMLDLAGIPLHADQRGGDDPIILGGDALADSPEPLAEFFDLFISGDGEVPMRQLVELVRRAKAAGANRDEMILQAARTIDGVYAPRFYRPRYDADGAFAGLDRTRDDVPDKIRRVHLPSMSDSPTAARPLVPLAEGIHERVVVEIMRGCPNSCRFCQAGATRLPVRVRKIEEILDIARRGIEATGFDEISLLSLSTSDYPHLEELIDALNAEFSSRHVSISLPSLRVGSQLKLLPKLTSQVRKGGLTIAAEAGSDRLRQSIRKGITEADMIDGVRAAYAAGWKSVKVYFMAGLPGETNEDIDAIFDLCIKLSNARRDVDRQRGSITASVSWFVPKPHTPMQWAPMRDAEYFWSVRNHLREVSYRSPITFRFHRIERSVLEGVLCRGDRRVGAAIEAAWRNGARMDSWDEHFDYNLWLAAFKQANIDPAAYAHRTYDQDKALPWSHIVCYRSEEYLRKEYGQMAGSQQAPEATQSE